MCAHEALKPTTARIPWEANIGTNTLISVAKRGLCMRFVSINNSQCAAGSFHCIAYTVNESVARAKPGGAATLKVRDPDDAVTLEPTRSRRQS